jgi:hypothetical protein
MAPARLRQIEPYDQPIRGNFCSFCIARCGSAFFLARERPKLILQIEKGSQKAEKRGKGLKDGAK